jgi:serine/threonine protein kinase
MEDKENLIYFEKYAVERLLGEGSYGKVKLAKDMGTNDLVCQLNCFLLFCRLHSKYFRKRQ